MSTKKDSPCDNADAYLEEDRHDRSDPDRSRFEHRKACLHDCRSDGRKWRVLVVVVV
jgi:hypothetical protein